MDKDAQSAAYGLLAACLPILAACSGSHAAPAATPVLSNQALELAQCTYATPHLLALNEEIGGRYQTNHGAAVGVVMADNPGMSRELATAMVDGVVDGLRSSPSVNVDRDQLRAWYRQSCI